MALTSTPRFALPQWGAGSDSPSRTTFNSGFTTLDAKAAYDDGAVGGSALPTTDVVVGRHAQTVNGAYRSLYRRVSTGWQWIGGNAVPETLHHRADSALPTTGIARQISHPSLTNPTVIENWDGTAVRGGRLAILEQNTGATASLHVGDASATDLAAKGRVYVRTTADGQRGLVLSAHGAAAGLMFSVQAGGSDATTIDALGRFRSQVPSAHGAATLTTGVPLSVGAAASDTSAADFYANTGKFGQRWWRAAGDTTPIGSVSDTAWVIGRGTWSGGSISLLAPTISATGAFGLTGAATISSTLGVTGATTLSSTLGVSGATTLSSTLSVSSTTTIGGVANLNSDVVVGGRLDLPTNQPSGTSAGQVRITPDYTLEVYDGTNWHGTFGTAAGTANGTGPQRKHSYYQANAGLAGGDNYVQVTGFPNGGGGGNIATMSGGGNLVLNKPGLWTVSGSMFLDHGREGMNRMRINWQGGAFPGRADLTDIRKRMITFGKAGSGQAECFISWTGYVTQAQANAPIRQYVAQLADDGSTSTATAYMLMAEYLGP